MPGYYAIILRRQKKKKKNQDTFEQCYINAACQVNSLETTKGCNQECVLGLSYIISKKKSGNIKNGTMNLQTTLMCQKGGNLF